VAHISPWESHTHDRNIPDPNSVSLQFWFGLTDTMYDALDAPHRTIAMASCRRAAAENTHTYPKFGFVLTA
jgi:hypothetical protein